VATKDLVKVVEWARSWPAVNIGVATGQASGMIAIDIDPRHGGDKSLQDLIDIHGALPATWTVETGGDGLQYYFRLPSVRIANATKVRPGIDVRGEGGYVVAPPSVHKSGKSYAWKKGCAPGECELAPLPAWLLELIAPPIARPAIPVAASRTSVPSEGTASLSVGDDSLVLLAHAEKYLAAIPFPDPGERNDATFRIAGHLAAFKVRGSNVGLSQELLEEMLVRWNLQAPSPLPDDEVRRTVKSALESGTPRDPKWIDPPLGVGKGEPGLPEALARCALSWEYVVDCRNTSQVFARLGLNLVPVRSAEFAGHLRSCVWEGLGLVPGDQMVSTVAKFVAYHVQRTAPRIAVDLRVGGSMKEVVVDLCDEARTVIRVTANGHRLEPGCADACFYRPEGAEALPTPVKVDGALGQLRALLNITQDRVWRLLVGWMLGTMSPTGPYLALSICGPQGAAKSSLTRMLRMLLDPHAVKPRGMPASVRDLMICASRNRLLAFDNLSTLNRELSDAFCRIACDAGYGVRKLYSDADEVVFTACRPFVFNGISNVIVAPDLLDRAIVLELPTIADAQRRPEREIWSIFEGLRAGILHELLEAVSMAMRNLESTKIKELPRMADAVQWIVAGAPALGMTGDEFLEAFRQNRSAADDIAIEASPIGTALLSLMASTPKWEGTAAGLLIELTRIRNETVGTFLHRAAQGRGAFGSQDPRDCPESGAARHRSCHPQKQRNAAHRDLSTGP
jgi:hypothetical protein